MTCSVDVFPVPPFQENSYLFSDMDAGAAMAVDPGGRVADILERARERRVEIVLIANTHAHIDHVLGVAELKAATGAPFRVHPDAAATLGGMPEQAAIMGLGEARVPVVDAPLAAGDRFNVGTQEFTVRYTPGHAPGHVTLVAQAVPLAGGPATLAFCGDVIFRGSIGRTDLEGGDYEVLMTAIDAEIMTLAPDTVLLSGHGPRTTVAAEAEANPFLLEWRRTRA